MKSIKIILGIFAIVIVIPLIIVLLFNLCYTPPPPRYDSISQADLRNSATAQEAYYVDNDIYADSADKIIGPLYGFFLSDGVELQVLSADSSHYDMIAFHKKGDSIWHITGPGGTIEREDKDGVKP